MDDKPMILPDDDVRMNEDDRRDLDAAKEKNKDTTKAARRALKVARETQAVAEHTLVALDGQTAKINRLDGKMVEMKEDVKRSENYLRFITRFCVCCNCFVTDPTTKEEGVWSKEAKTNQVKEKRGDAGKPQKQKPGATAGGSDSGRMEKLKIVSEMIPMKMADGNRRKTTSLCPGARLARSITDPPSFSLRSLPLFARTAAGDELKEIHSEFQEQDMAMDEISFIVTNLNGMSKAMGEEISKQNALIEELDGKATPLKVILPPILPSDPDHHSLTHSLTFAHDLFPCAQDRIRDMNTRTRLSKIHVKKKTSGSVITDVGSTLMKNM